MDFDLPPELAELQATVRKLAREQVAPRAREIDDSDEYPEDLFRVFVDAGLTGLCVPEEYGGSGAGILGLAGVLAEASGWFWRRRLGGVVGDDVGAGGVTCETAAVAVLCAGRG